MMVQLRPEQEQVIEEAVKAGLITNADEVVDVGIEAIRHRLKTRGNDATAPALSADEWEGEFDTWIASFPDTAPLPDEALSRENMYPDRW